MKRKMLFSAAVVAAAVILSGCVAGYPGYGMINKSREVTGMFEQKALPTGYTYYYVGSDSEPDCVIGVAPGYTLKTNVWKQVDMTSGVLDQWMRTMTGGLGAGTGMWGAALTDKDGNRVGIWYSKYNTTAVKVGANKELTIYPPASNLIEESDAPYNPLNSEVYEP